LKIPHIKLPKDAPLLQIVYQEGAQFEARRQYIISAGPHGIHGHATGLLSWTGSPLYEKFPDMAGKLIGVVASVIFSLPGARELFLAGGFRDASRSVCERILSEGKSLYIITGGEAESLLSAPGTDILVLKPRLGFVRLALKHGCSLVPTYMFGNTDVFSTSKVLYGARKWLSKNFRVCIPIYWGRWGTLLPYSKRITYAIGRPIQCPKLEPGPDGRLDDATVKEYHDKFVTAVQGLFEEFKAEAGYDTSRQLQIV